MTHPTPQDTVPVPLAQRHQHWKARQDRMLKNGSLYIPKQSVWGLCVCRKATATPLPHKFSIVFRDFAPTRTSETPHKQIHFSLQQILRSDHKSPKWNSE